MQLSRVIVPADMSPAWCTGCPFETPDGITRWQRTALAREHEATPGACELARAAARAASMSRHPSRAHPPTSGRVRRSDGR